MIALPLHPDLKKGDIYIKGANVLNYEEYLVPESS